MARATRVLGATSLVGASLALWLYLDNRALRAALATRPAAPTAAATTPAAAAAAPSPWAPRTVAPVAHTTAAPAPALPEPSAESETQSRMERRARRTDEFAAMFGRLDGESDAEYRARILPMLTAGLMVPRMRLDEQRKIAQDKAHVTAEQSARLDQAFDKVYGDVLDYTNKAISDGQLSPYERNVSGWLEFAGGLGGLLHDANGQIGKILDPSQVRAMSDAGFEWGEYLGVKAPWEKLTPPPPRTTH
ncbi:MAG TPA: hypothetical protein VHT91_40165 [Kofleriaceae bacterium]|jgi:hypothetical protein|nr:hypothetical protein [Kofleriaceae bacterium]